MAEKVRCVKEKGESQNVQNAFYFEGGVYPKIYFVYY